MAKHYDVTMKRFVCENFKFVFDSFFTVAKQRMTFFENGWPVSLFSFYGGKDRTERRKEMKILRKREREKERKKREIRSGELYDGLGLQATASLNLKSRHQINFSWLLGFYLWHYLCF